MRSLSALPLTLVLLAAACGSSVDEVADVATTETQTTETPATEAPTTEPETTETTEYENAVVTSSPEEEAIVQNWDLALGTAPFADRSHTIVGADELEATVESYNRAVAGFGSIVLPVTAIEINSETATVTYDVLGNGVAMATELSGEMVLTDGEWQVTRDSFCEAMSLARNPCPAG